jgi:hypothetical protein
MEMGEGSRSILMSTRARKMKKSGLTFAWFMLLIFVSSAVIAQDSGPPEGTTGMPSRGFYSTTGSEARQRFLDDTVELRRALVVKQAEYNALKAQTDPDPKRAAKLAQEIFDIQEQLRVKANDYGIKGEASAGNDGRGHREPPVRRRPQEGWYCW